MNRLLFAALFLATIAFPVKSLLADDAVIAPAPREHTSGVAPALPRLPLSKLAPAKPMFDACLYRYGVSTTNAQCQAYVNQALGMYYSYVWMEAVRAAETALTHDPECAYAWLILHRSLEKWGSGASAPKATAFAGLFGAATISTLPEKVVKAPVDYSLDMARKLMPRANHREQLLIQSRLQEKGMWPGVGPDERKKKAQQTLDELLSLHDDDEEGWFWRAQLANSDGPNAAAPYYKALLRINPLNPGANHEFVHYFENIKRPALGWPFAEGYVKSSPGIPHALHMQAHLATRIGKWGPTTDWSARAIELEMEYHKYQGVKPNEDYQFIHQLQTLTRSLVHDGRFEECKKVKSITESNKSSFWPEWFTMALLQQDWTSAQKAIDQFRKTDKSTGAYYASLYWLEQGDLEHARREFDTLRQLQQSRKMDKNNERRMWEVQGRYLCLQGDSAAGLKLLRKLVDASKNDYNSHAWGAGAVYMESWGIGALEAGAAVEAEEAFQEALAHDAGSVRAALGLWALCERLDRTEEADRYLKLAHRCWARASTQDFATQQTEMARRASHIAKPTIATTGQSPR